LNKGILGGGGGGGIRTLEGPNGPLRFSRPHAFRSTMRPEDRCATQRATVLSKRASVDALADQQGVAASPSLSGPRPWSTRLRRMMRRYRAAVLNAVSPCCRRRPATLATRFLRLGAGGVCVQAPGELYRPAGRDVVAAVDPSASMPSRSRSAGATRCQSLALPPPPWISANVATAQCDRGDARA
jgi:hypothetical protein